MSEEKYPKDGDNSNNTDHTEMDETVAAELAYKLKLKMALQNKVAFKNQAALKKKKSFDKESPGLSKEETHDLALRLLKKKTMTLKQELGKEGPALTFSGIPVLTPEMILELKAREKRKLMMQMELAEKLQQEMKLQMENKLKNKEAPRMRRKIKPSWMG
jgi:hypothetical protein